MEVHGTRWICSTCSVNLASTKINKKLSRSIKEATMKEELIDIHVNIPAEVNEKLNKISEDRAHGEKTFHIVSALKAYLRKWEIKHGKI